MTKLASSKLATRRQLFLERTATVYGISTTEAEQLFSIKRAQSFRVNPLVTRSSDDQAIIDKFERYGWTSEFGFDGYAVGRDMRQLDDLQNRGVVFVQNASSWLPVIALNAQPGETVLDVCAAPGAKTSMIAALAGDQVLIRANDISPNRIAKLKRTLDQQNVTNASVTLSRGENLSKGAQNASYDRILLDAPCSGDGMINLDDPKAFSAWSIKSIDRLAGLQHKLLKSAWSQLRPGGTLVYSTCTVAPEENELIIADFLKRHDDAEIVEVNLPAEITHAAVVESWRNKQISEEIRAKVIRIRHGGNFEAFFLAKIVKKT